MVYWFNGALGRDAPRLDAGDRGFTLGDGLFETIRVAGGAPRHLQRHFARLAAGLDVLGFTIPYDAAALADAVGALVAEGPADAVLRLTATRGPGGRGASPPAHPTPTVLMTLVAAPAVPVRARAVTATVTRRNHHSPLSRIKSLNFLDNVLARREAEARGADEAVLLNTEGRVAEGATATLFARLEGRLATPPIAEGALPGTVRAAALETGLAEERALSPEQLAAADEIVLTNALSVRAVIRLDERDLPGPGPLFRVLADLFEG
jgi:branched-chain amino acid aminotransferase